jgi:hypothetical protein
MSIYMIIAIICIILLFATVILGDFGGDMDADVDMDFDGDLGHIELGHGDFSAGISPLSIPILLVFGTGFGSFGALLEIMNVHFLVVPVISAGASALVAGGVYLFMVKVFVRAQATSTIILQDLVGKDAIVSIPIKPGSLGQIIVVTDERGRSTISAVSDEELPTDSIVEIKKVVADGVFVKKKI